MKILSICVPSYNMEQYIVRCIDSLLISEILDKLEIIIVNDGSKDSTLAIAKQYESQYPQSIIVVDKPNGHYGSTVNAALKVATGKYFRLLDADDWFDSQALIKMINVASRIDVDCIFTRYTTHDFGKNTIIEQNPKGVIYDKILSLDEYIIPDWACLAMHSLTYRLQLLKDIKYVQTEGICYTDMEYIYFPLREAKTIYNINISLYQYYIGRDEQSVSIKSRINNFSHFKILIEKFIDNYNIDEVRCNKNAANIQDNCLLGTIGAILRIGILYREYDIKTDSEMRAYLQRAKKVSPNVYRKVFRFRHRGIPFVFIWHKLPMFQNVFLSPIRYYLAHK